MRLRKRAIGLLIGAGVLFLLGTNVQAGWLFVLAALLLGATIAGIVGPIRATRGLRLERCAPDEVHQGETVRIELVVRADGRATRRGVLVHDAFLDPVDLWVGPVRAAEAVELATERTARRRGRHVVAELQVRSAAPFGVAERRRRATCEGGSTLVVPAVEPLGDLPFVDPAPTSAAAMHADPRRGLGPEYLGVREYRSGDSMRHVHWASTARTGSLMVREFEQERTRRLAIVADVARDAEPDPDDPLGRTPLDRVCSATASIALASLGEGHGVRVLHALPTVGDGVEVLVRTDRATLLEHLALIEAVGEEGTFPSLVADAADDLRGVEAAVIVFPTWREHDAERLAPAAARLAERIATVVAVPVLLTGRRDALRSDQVDGLTQRLRAAGVAVRPWAPGVPLGTALGAREVGTRAVTPGVAP